MYLPDDAVTSFTSTFTSTERIKTPHQQAIAHYVAMNTLRYPTIQTIFLIASLAFLDKFHAFTSPVSHRTPPIIGSSASPLRHQVSIILRSSPEPLPDTATKGSKAEKIQSVTVADKKSKEGLEFELPVYVKQEEESQFLADTLKTNILFEQAPSDTLNLMVAAFEKVEYPRGTVIMKQRDKNADFMLVMGAGQCSISIDGQQLKEPYGTMSKGSMIGELALLYETERSATVTAKTDVTAFRLKKDSFSYFISRLEQMEDIDIKQELKSIDLAIDQISGVKTKYDGEIIRQFKPSPFWLWRRWSGTVLQHAWKRAVLNMLLSAVVVGFVRHRFKPTWAIGMIPDSDFPIIKKFVGLSKLWHYLMNIATFILTFFLSQAYAIWREMYRITRGIQGSFSDFGLILASSVERDHHGAYTAESEALLNEVADYSRLYHAFAWARATKKFKIILSKRGISRMLSRGLIGRKQYDVISSLNDGANGPHNACLTWIIIKCLNAMKAKTLPNDHALRDLLFHATLQLRSFYAQVGDLVSDLDLLTLFACTV